MNPANHVSRLVFFALWLAPAIVNMGGRHPATRPRKRRSRRPLRSFWHLEHLIDMPLRVLIVDDSETVRRITRTILRSRHWTVCGEADDGVSGLQKFEQLKPDVVLLDLSMPDINGIEAAKLMSAANSAIPLVLFTILEVAGIEEEARQAGIRAIVPKNEAWNLIPSIEALVRHRSKTQAH